jgi:biopolymer transport protein ExbB/TolQ
MDLKTFSDVTALHAHLNNLLQQRVESLRNLPQSPKALLTAKQAALRQAEKAAKTAEQTHDRVVRRAAAHLEQSQKEVDSLARELKELEIIVDQELNFGTKPKRDRGKNPEKKDPKKRNG